MKITVLDIDSIGRDIDLSPITSIGECEVFSATEADEVVSRLKDTDVAVLNKIKMTGQVLERTPKLKLICVAATGFDNIDLDYCRKAGIAVATADELQVLLEDYTS